MRLDTGRVDLIQEALERFQIKNTLRLDVLRAVFDLLAQLVDLQLDGVIDRSDGSPLSLLSDTSTSHPDSAPPIRDARL